MLLLLLTYGSLRECRSLNQSTVCERVLASKQVTALENHPYSPHLASNDFFIFPKIKETLKGRHFGDSDNIRSNTTAALKATTSKIAFKGGLGAGNGA
jgi:hypothetical protein